MLYKILYNKRIEQNKKKIKYHKVISKQKKYFLLCGNCYWMASTLPCLPNTHTIHSNKCPKCDVRLDKFLIRNDKSA